MTRRALPEVMTPYDGTHVRLFATARPSAQVAWERMEGVQPAHEELPKQRAAPSASRSFSLRALLRRPRLSR